MRGGRAVRWERLAAEAPRSRPPGARSSTSTGPGSASSRRLACRWCRGCTRCARRHRGRTVRVRRQPVAEGARPAPRSALLCCMPCRRTCRRRVRRQRMCRAVTDAAVEGRGSRPTSPRARPARTTPSSSSSSTAGLHAEYGPRPSPPPMYRRWQAPADCASRAGHGPGRCLPVRRGGLARAQREAPGRMFEEPELVRRHDHRRTRSAAAQELGERGLARGIEADERFVDQEDGDGRTSPSTSDVFWRRPRPNRTGRSPTRSSRWRISRSWSAECG